MRKSWIRTGLVIVCVLSVIGFYTALSQSSDANGWQRGSDAAPAGLMQQVIQENIAPDFQVDSGRMRVWRIQQSGQPDPLYLIDSRVASAAESASANPLCGASGCAFFGYIQQGDRHQRVFADYLDPRLPPNIPLFEVPHKLQNRLPVLIVNQMENNQIRQLTLSFNDREYEVTETQLLPQRYE